MEGRRERYSVHLSSLRRLVYSSCISFCTRSPGVLHPHSREVSGDKRIEFRPSARAEGRKDAVANHESSGLCLTSSDTAEQALSPRTCHPLSTPFSDVPFLSVVARHNPPNARKTCKSAGGLATPGSDAHSSPQIQISTTMFARFGFVHPPLSPLLMTCIQFPLVSSYFSYHFLLSPRQPTSHNAWRISGTTPAQSAALTPEVAQRVLQRRLDSPTRPA